MSPREHPLFRWGTDDGKVFLLAEEAEKFTLDIRTLRIIKSVTISITMQLVLIYFRAF